MYDKKEISQSRSLQSSFSVIRNSKSLLFERRPANHSELLCSHLDLLAISMIMVKCSSLIWKSEKDSVIYIIFINKYPYIYIHTHNTCIHTSLERVKSLNFALKVFTYKLQKYLLDSPQICFNHECCLHYFFIRYVWNRIKQIKALQIFQ